MKLVDNSWTKKQLYAECKNRGIAGCSGLSKNGLIQTLNQGEKTATDNHSTKNSSHNKKSTVPELREECRRRGLRNFWKLKKAGLLNLLKGEVTATIKASTSTSRQRKGPTVPELRDECRRRGLRNYGKLRKAELINLLTDHWIDGKSTHSRVDGNEEGGGRGEDEEKIEGAGEGERGRGEGGDGRGGAGGGGRGVVGKGKNSRKYGPLRSRAQERFDIGPTPLDTPGFLYIYSEPGGAVNEWKIGKTTLDPPERRMLQSARNNKKAYELKASWHVAWCGYVEKIVHLDIDDLRIVPGKEKQGGGEREDGGTEWFRADFDVIEARVRLVLRMVAAREADEADVAGVSCFCGIFRCGLPKRRRSAAKH